MIFHTPLNLQIFCFISNITFVVITVINAFIPKQYTINGRYFVQFEDRKVLEVMVSLIRQKSNKSYGKDRI